jgi:hypothetical protein
MTAQVEIARQEWAEGHRRYRAAAGDRARFERLSGHVAAVTDELRRRVGQVFTLGELADEYGRAEAWRATVAAGNPLAPLPADVATAEDAAFHLYARGARDFAP